MCAENTGAIMFTMSGLWNYLRVRGEYVSQNAKVQDAEELPPCARRIRVFAG